MDDIRQESANEGPIFSLNKKLCRQSLNIKFGIHVEISIAFKTKQCIPRYTVVSGETTWCV